MYAKRSRKRHPAKCTCSSCSKGVRKSGYRGGSRYGGGGGKGNRYVRYRRAQAVRAPVRSRAVYKRRLPKKGSNSSRPSGWSRTRMLALLTRDSVSPSGTYTIGGASARVTWAPTQQGAVSLNGIYTPADVISVIGAGLVKVAPAPNDATVAGGITYENKFWIRRARVRYDMTNCYQSPISVRGFPVMSRYDSYQNLDPFDAVANEGLYESSPIFGHGTALGTQNTPGWSPYKSTFCTQTFKIGKVRTFSLAPGQRCTFYQRDSRPFYFNVARYLALAGSTAGTWGGRTKGMIFTFLASAVNDSVTATKIAYGPGAVDVITTVEYEWVAPVSPLHYRSMSSISPVIANGPQVILPMSGTIVTPSAV